MNKIAITEQVIIIDEERVKPIGKTSIRNKTHVTKPEKDKSKKGGLIINKKAIIGKNRVLTRKQSKKDMKIPNPKIRSEGYESKRIQNRSQSKQTRKNSLELLAEAASSILHRKRLI
jgi:hypothetical protein